MCLNKHGMAVSVVLLSLLVGPGLAGCSRGQSGQPGGEARADDQAATQEGQSDALPPPELRSEVLERQPLNVPPDLANLRPVEVLPDGEQMTLYRAMAPLRLRVARADGTTLSEVEADSGQVLVVDRRTGVKLGGEVLVRGPLEEHSVYAIYALPTGGVRQEATRTLIRPETPAEREERAQAEAEAQRRQEQQGGTTRPSTSPTGG